MKTVLVLAGLYATALTMAMAAEPRPPVKVARAVLSAPAARMQSVTADDIRMALERAIADRLGGSATEVQVRLLDEPEPLTLPSGRIDIRPKAWPEDVLGRRIMQVSVLVDGTVVRSLTVRTETFAWAEAVIAARQIKADEVLQPEDIVVEKLSLGPGKPAYLRSAEAAVGKRLTKAVAGHKPIPATALGEPYAVKRGDRVTIEARRGSLLVQTAGITKGPAQSGESVTVTNLDSGKDVRARVLGPGSVRVEFR